VNKVSTKVALRFDLPVSRALSDGTRSRLGKLARARIRSDGSLVVVCQQTRNQARNLELAREKLAELVRAALIAPRPRRATRRSAGSERARLESKRKQSERKRSRRNAQFDG
jgi:ribosome-associated protein